MADVQEQILGELVRIRKAMEALALHLGAGQRAAAQGGNGSAPAAGAVASDRDLDGQYGDRKVGFDPKAWAGEGSFKGARMSECPPDFLDAYADALDDLASRKDGDEAKWTRLDAARARGWAKRKRTQGDNDFR
jgi:hypothetical protein